MKSTTLPLGRKRIVTALPSFSAIFRTVPGGAEAVG